MANIEQFSVSPEFEDILPVLKEWTKGPPEGQEPVYGGAHGISKSRHICMAIRMYTRHTTEYLALMEKVGEARDDQKIDQMAIERQKLLAPIMIAATTTTTVKETATAVSY
jgi:hypothetical protein